MGYEYIMLALISYILSTALHLLIICSVDHCSWTNDYSHLRSLIL